MAQRLIKIAIRCACKAGVVAARVRCGPCFSRYPSKNICLAASCVAGLQGAVGPSWIRGDKFVVSLRTKKRTMGTVGQSAGLRSVFAQRVARLLAGVSPATHPPQCAILVPPAIPWERSRDACRRAESRAVDHLRASDSRLRYHTRRVAHPEPIGHWRESSVHRVPSPSVPSVIGTFADPRVAAVGRRKNRHTAPSFALWQRFLPIAGTGVFDRVSAAGGSAGDHLSNSANGIVGAPPSGLAPLGLACNATGRSSLGRCVFATALASQHRVAAEWRDAAWLRGNRLNPRASTPGLRFACNTRCATQR